MVDGILLSYAPRKEGRSRHCNFNIRNFRQSVHLRAIAFAFGITAIYIFFSISFKNSRGLTNTGVDSVADSLSEPLVRIETSKARQAADLESNLRAVTSLLPAEVTMRELLSELPGSGIERLRELAFRTRAFKMFFEAWEALHLVTNGDSDQVRDDIVPYLKTISSGQTLADTTRRYEKFRCFFLRLSNRLFPWISPYWASHVTLHSHFRHGGRGVVMSGGDNQATYLLTSIQAFRNLGCTLPIEIMYLGDGDLSEDYRQKLEDLPDVITRDMSQMINDEGWRVTGWASKPFAMLMSSFREVIFIDADSLFFENPAVLFDEPGYVETGALFFRDRRILPESKKRWLQAILPTPISSLVKQSYMWTGESGHYQESGVVVVDKWKHFVAMLLATRLNGPDRDGDHANGIVGVYDMVYGDKETYWLAWELSGDHGYSFHQGSAGAMGVAEEDRQVEPPNYTICAPQLLHLNLDGSPLWFNGWIMARKENDKKKEKFVTFERYSAEPNSTVGENEAWIMRQNNICCLTTKETSRFTESQKNVLDMIKQVARKVKDHNEV